MKITKKQLRQIIRESLREGYNSMSSAGKADAQRMKRKFMKDHPDAKVGIDAREGWITVNGKKAVNMSQASGRPITDEEIIHQMKVALDPNLGAGAEGLDSLASGASDFEDEI